MKNLKRTLILLLSAPLFALALSGCFESDAENAVEDVGEKIEDSANKASDKVDEVIDDME